MDSVESSDKRYEFFDGKCAIKNCELDELAAGFCNKHWRRLKKYGSPLWLSKPAGAYRGLPVEDRFFPRVNKTNTCWNWQSGCDQDGYGTFMGEVLGTTYRRAHRFSWAYHNKQLIPPGMEVLHSCDNRRCVNPAHLSIGTTADNQSDKWLRGRGRPNQGTKHWKCKLTEEQVKEIRSSSEPRDVLATKYGMTKWGIASVRQRQSWKHID